MHFRNALPWILAVGLCLAACGDDTEPDDDDAADDDSGATDDDDSAAADDDDDTGPDPLAPVLSDLALSHAMAGDECRAYLTFNGTDPDGDIAQSAVHVFFSPVPPFSWNFDTGSAPPLYEVAYAIDILVSDGAVVPHLPAEGVYDVEVWVDDEADHESNHLFSPKWQAPTETCE